MVLDKQFALSGLRSGRVLRASWPSGLRLAAGYLTVSFRTLVGTEGTGYPSWEEELSSWGILGVYEPLPFSGSNSALYSKQVGQGGATALPAFWEILPCSYVPM